MKYPRLLKTLVYVNSTGRFVIFLWPSQNITTLPIYVKLIEVQLMPCPFTVPKMFCTNFLSHIYILCQSQTFCAIQKDDLHSVKLVFVPAQKILKRH